MIMALPSSLDDRARPCLQKKKKKIAAEISSLQGQKNSGSIDTNQKICQDRIMCQIRVVTAHPGMRESTNSIFVTLFFVRDLVRKLVLLTEYTSCQQNTSLLCFLLISEYYVIFYDHVPNIRTTGVCDQEIIGCQRHDLALVKEQFRAGIEATMQGSTLKNTFVFCKSKCLFRSLLYPQNLTHNWCINLFLKNEWQIQIEQGFMLCNK